MLSWTFSLETLKINTLVQRSFAEETLWSLEEIGQEHLFSTVQLLNSVAHLISSTVRGLFLDVFHSVTNLTTKPMYWNKRVTFFTSGTVLDRDCHMLIIYFPLVSLCNFLMLMLVTLQTGLRLRNQTSCIASSPPFRLPLFHTMTNHHFASCTSCRNCFIPSISGVETMGSSCTNPDTDAYRETNVATKRFASVEDCTVHLVLPVFPSQCCKDLPMHFYSF